MNFPRSIFFCLLLFTSRFSFSQLGGKNSYEFLNLPVSARVSALGGNLIAAKDNDLGVAFANPALLTDTMTNNVALSYTNYFADINYGYAGYAKNIKKNQNIGFGIQYLDYGKFNSADETGAITGSFGANEMSLHVSYARSLVDTNLTLGATLKTIYSNLNTYTSIGSAIDLGGVYIFPKQQLSIATVIKNAGIQWKSFTPNNREKLPFEMQVGISKKLKHSPFRFSLAYENIEKWNLTNNDSLVFGKKSNPMLLQGKGKYKIYGDRFMRHIVIGGEINVSKNIFIRIGYNYQRRQELKVSEKKGLTGFSFGFGVNIKKIQLSYGRAVYSLAGASNVFSLGVDLTSFYKKKAL